MNSKKPKVVKATSSVQKAAKEAESPEVPQKRLKIFELKLTADELAHFRDLMSIMLPPDGTTTLSQSLAKVNQQKTMVEAKLWAKLVEKCKEADVPTDDEAPDYAVGVSGVPTLAVFSLQHTTPDSETE